MTKANDPVQPVPYHIELTPQSDTIGKIECVDGLTKREHFAAMAMQGILAAASTYFNEEYAAVNAVTYADALICALSKEPSGTTNI